MFFEEARLAARIRHPNVVSTLDIVAREGEVFLVMDYVPGLSVSRLVLTAQRANRCLPPRISSAIVIDTLLGLQAAHEAKSDQGDVLSIVHRDISPQNILLGSDGVARVVDFGIAKAASRAHTTQEGMVKGKLAYMSPEQVLSMPVDQRSDVFAVTVVLWELLTGRRLFAADDPAATIAKILMGEPVPPSHHVPGLDSEIDAVVARGLAQAREHRFSSAREMARALEAALPRAGTLEVEDWFASVAGEQVKTSAALVAQIEAVSANLHPVGVVPSGAASEDATVAGPIIEEPIASTDKSTLLESPAARRAAEPPSEVTDLSAARAALLPARQRLSRTSKFGAAAALIVALGASAAFLWHGRAELPREGLAAATPTHAASNAPVQTSAPSAPLLATIEPLKPPPSAAPVTPTSSTRAAKTTPARVAGTTGKRSRGLCDPPYDMKADGSKRFKPECF